MLNQVVLMGRLTADPEIVKVGDVCCAKIRIAIDRDYQKQGEEKKTDFIPCTAWRQTADFLGKYFHKGSMIAVTGSLQSRDFTDKEGNKRTSYEVNVDRVSFCGSKAEAGATPAATPVETTIDDESSLPFDF